MLFLTRGRMRPAAAALTTAALAATTLAFAGSPAQAAEEGSVNGLNWNISAQFLDHFSPKPYAPANEIIASDGASYVDGQVAYSFEDVSVEGGVTTVEYSGSVTGRFIVGVEQYAITVADPTIVFDEAGAGEIRATASNREKDVEPTSPAEVKVADFTGGSLSDGVFTVTPNFDGVLPADSAEAEALGISAGQPVDGKSFHPDFLGNLTAGARAHFYASGENQPKKAVADIEAAVFLPTVNAVATTSGNNVRIAVEGTNFDSASRPGAQGVYVGLSNERNIFKVDSDDQASGMASFLGSAHVSPAGFTDGAWSTTVNVNKKQLAKGIDYVIYTWTAHGNPAKGDSQYTATPVKVGGLAKAPTKINKKWKKKPTSKKKSALVVVVKSNKAINQSATATGKVNVKLKKGKQTKKVKATLNKKGQVKVKLPKLAKGQWKVVVNYGADKTFKKAKANFKVKVKK
ncbi:hypothetical protein [Nocardioides alcanivorans]|uniref:hypothetical protein n=1 Tax=Nocardioides alcanivorans TaxID=2897352 RepID=UPI001F376741|nr:hypothetical protein [Nocardioides alcanivorans]